MASDDFGGITRLNDCFPWIQNSLEKLFLSRLGVSSNSSISLNEFEYLPSPNDLFFVILKNVIPLLIMISCCISVNKIVKNVALERESRLKEMMKIMGLSSVVHWLSWFTSSLLMLMISFSAISIILCYKVINDDAIFTNSDVILVWIFFFVYLTGIITFSFLISVIFKKSKTAGTLGTILFIITFAPYFLYRSEFSDLNIVFKYFFCLPINTGLGQGISIIYFLEIKKTGLQFSNIFSRNNYENFAIADVMLSMILSSLSHVLITIYIEQVFTGDVGVAKKWFFPVEKLLRIRQRNPENSTINYERLNVSNEDDFEADPNLEVGIKIDKVTKLFGESTVVNQLSFNMYKGQITVLLGHNGAGKTTTMVCIFLKKNQYSFSRYSISLLFEDSLVGSGRSLFIVLIFKIFKTKEVREKNNRVTKYPGTPNNQEMR